MIELFSHREGGSQVFSLKGRLEFGDFTESSQVLEAFDSASIERVVIDLKDLEFMDSAGVGLLIGLNKTAVEKGKPMALRGATGAVKELVELFQLGTVFEIQ